MERWRREARSFARRAPVRERYDTVLIVCEGAKTEPNYFGRLKRIHGLASMEIETPKGSDPMSIVRHGLARAEDKELDLVYCVFDHDNRPNFNEAVQHARASDAGRAGKLVPITSHPCFEIWALLHFGYHDAPFTDCEDVIRAIRDYRPDYEKSLENDLEILFQNIDRAIEHGKRLARHNLVTASVNPATGLHDLTEHLRNLRK